MIYRTLRIPQIFILIIMISLFGCGKNNKKQENPQITVGIGKYYKDNLPYIIKFPQKLPKIEIRKKLPLLVIISWKYDGKKNNGLPNIETNTKMLALEKEPKENDLFFHAYTKTGNNLKEIVYYCPNKEDFLKMMNNDIKNKPIEIYFCKDIEWENLNKTIKIFNN